MPLPLFNTSFIYNGYAFPSNMRTEVREKPVMSEDGRQVRYSEITISVKWYVTQAELSATGSGAVATALTDGNAVTAITVVSGGSGYVAPPIVTITPSGGAGSGATATATINASGAVTAVTVTNGGTGYTIQPVITFSPAGGAAGPGTTDAYLENLRRLLTKPGKQLIYSGKGFGSNSLNVNGGGPIFDAAFGPSPGELIFSPLGGAPIGNLAAVCRWSVTTRIPECTTALYLPGNGVFNQFAFTVDVAIDEAGYSVVTTRGNFEIPMSLWTDDSILASADDNWEYALGPIPTGFRRTTRRTLSADRRRIDFTTTDTQLPGAPLPRTVVKADVRHRLNNPKPMNILAWTNTISGTLTINSATATKADAWAEIYNIITARMDWARSQPLSQFDNSLNPFPGGQRPANNKCMVLVQNFEIDDALFNDEFHFSVNYRLLGCSLADVLAVSGMWRSIGTDWGLWASKMSAGPTKPRGLANFTFDVDQDTIINVCDPQVAQGAINVAGNADVPDQPTDEDDEEEDDDLAASPALFMNPNAAYSPESSGSSNSAPMTQLLSPASIGPAGTPTAGGGGILGLLDPSSSWIAYETEVRYVEEGNIVRHKPLSGSPQYSLPDVDPLGSAEDMAEDTDPPAANVSNSTQDILQQCAGPSASVILQGQAMRLAFPIPVPMLVSYGGIDFTNIKPARKVIVPRTVMTVAGVDVNTLEWMVEYLIPQPPASLDTPANPFLWTDGPNASD